VWRNNNLQILKALVLCSVLNGITQFHLPPTRFEVTREEQDLEHYIRNELVNVATYFTDHRTMEAESSYLFGRGVELLNRMIEHAPESVR
jgi:hypothetical protein